MKEPLVRDSRKSVVYMFSEPIAANEIMLRLYYSVSADPNDVCRSGINYHFCVQMEFYGKDLG